MNSEKKIEQLQSIIAQSLLPLIDNDYYLLELPYHSNVGDSLIWQGELDFLKMVPFKCLGFGSLWTFNFPAIQDDAVILLHGGGNFGDLYEIHHTFKMDVVERYPNNKIVFFPQTVWFGDERKFLSTMSVLSKHKNVFVCARDQVSFEKIKDSLGGRALLVPDMAFFINMKKWKTAPLRCERPLLLKRTDQEYRSSESIETLMRHPNIHVSDWPSMMEPMEWQTKYMYKVRGTKKFWHRFCDFYADFFYRKHLIQSGIRLVNSHSMIYTTRLHVAILSVLLGKNVEFLDNSYGKNSSFYNTWLSDCDCIRPYEK